MLQAKEKAAQKQQEMAQEQDDNLTELCNHVHGDTLTENPAVAQSAFGPHRYSYNAIQWFTIQVEQLLH